MTRATGRSGPDTGSGTNIVKVVAASMAEASTPAEVEVSSADAAGADGAGDADVAEPDSAWGPDPTAGRGARGAGAVGLGDAPRIDTADLGDIPATHRRVTLQYVDIMRVRDGRIVEHWHTMDQLSFLQQLGAL